jgi:hypothetical protein
VCKVDPGRSGQGAVAGRCNSSNETSDTIKHGEFIDQLSDYQLLICVVSADGTQPGVLHVFTEKPAVIG